MIPFNSKLQPKFQMIQDYSQKYRMLKTNLNKSQNLNEQIKQEILKIGSESNTLLISVSFLTDKIAELRSLKPQKIKQLSFLKEDLKRCQYKTQKHQIKLKQYEQRAKKFQQVYQSKKQKNQTLKNKVQNLEQKINQQKEKKAKFIQQIEVLQPKIEPSNMESLKAQSVYLKNLHKKSNPIDEMELYILNNQMKTKKLAVQEQELRKKNAQMKSNITKLQQKITEITDFLNKTSDIPQFKQQTGVEPSEKYAISSRSSRVQEERILRYPGKQNLWEEKKSNRQSRAQSQTPKNDLPNHTLSSFANYENLESKSMLDKLLSKNTEINQKQEAYIQNLGQSWTLMNELTKINSQLESQIALQNSKVSALTIKTKKYTQLPRKFLY